MPPMQRAALAPALVLVAIISAGCAGDNEDDSVARGLAFVSENCATCHAVGADDQSPVADAPPFRSLQFRYPLEALEEALAEGIVTGHPDMPQFALDPDQIVDVLAYLRSLPAEPVEGE